eukprot:scaffold8064_cov24-Phaeocystis_antarctica.AAC.1
MLVARRPRGGKGVGVAAAHAACRRGPEWGSVGRGTRGAHKKHPAQRCDAGRVEAQRLVERRRVLPSRKEGIRCWRHAGREAARAWGWLRRMQRAGEVPNGDRWGGARAERTLNM